MKIETITLNAARDVTLTAFLQIAGGEFSHILTRPAVLVIPGGRYAMCSEREADPVALAYAQAGYQAFILRYSVGEQASWPNPLCDYEQAMALIRCEAEKWNVNPDQIAVAGFSSGGHLAAAAATMSVHRPNAAILGYPVTELDTVRKRLLNAPDVVSAVDHRTCPCFVFATRTDSVVPVSNTIHFIEALDRAGVAFESHIYGYGPHGISTGNDSVLAPGTGIPTAARRWIEDSVDWLGDIFGCFRGRMENGTLL